MYELVYEHQNEQATKPLVLSLNITCNTEEETILRNVLENSKLPRTWIKREEPHDRIAVICGSGPSIEDEIETIRSLWNDGARVFALNGAAKWLDDHGILADYQVIMDARQETAGLIGEATDHLFASQCDPALFDARPHAILWHSTHGDVLVDEQEGFDAKGREYCLIGSSATVGNTAMTLVHAMGYRTQEIFGMDSSHRGDRAHVAHQSMNDGDPTMLVKFRDREFLCSFTMKMQAECFKERAKALQDDGATINVHGDGYLPVIWNNPLSEQEKYDAIWRNPSYSECSPGERIAQTFCEVCHPTRHSRIADFGCGSGKGALAIHGLTGARVICVDFVEHSRIKEARHFEFIQSDLSGRQGLPLYAHLGFCADVMEHIPTDLVGTTIDNVMGACGSCFFQISTVPDDMGELIGETLHLTVKPHSWWRDKFCSLGYAVAWEREEETTALFWIKPLTT